MLEQVYKCDLLLNSSHIYNDKLIIKLKIDYEGVCDADATSVCLRTKKNIIKIDIIFYLM